MTRKDAIEELRDVLVNRRDALKRALAGDLSMLNELRGQTKGDVIDFALDAAQDEISSQLAEVESRELTSIDLALGAMREGHYGSCEACEEDIPLARLQALPYATMCIGCQREAEKSGIDGRAADWGRAADAEPIEKDVALSDLEMDAT